MDPIAPQSSAIRFADRTTLGVGGPARAFFSCGNALEIRRALDWAHHRQLPTFVLGGGSNLLVADAGYPGSVIELTDGSWQVDERSGTPEEVRLRVGAGLEWDALVALTVGNGWAGLECLSGIPGRVGAAPIQNIGAYGQEVAETLRAVRVVDRQTGEVLRIPADACGFGYRHSRFKAEWQGRYVIASIELALRIGGAPTVRYPELRGRLGMEDQQPLPSLEEVRRAVLEIRRSKSMVIRENDPNRRSAGSFFVNPVVSRDRAEAVAERARSLGIDRQLPRYPANEPGEPEREKLSAAWLIQEAGFPRGYERGRAGLSSRHTLALINRGEATAEDLVELAREIRQRVRDRFGITLVPEPVFLGFERGVDELLG